LIDAFAVNAWASGGFVARVVFSKGAIGDYT
jgi:hypothetical protein